MSSDDAEFVKQSEGARLLTPRRVTRNGVAVRDSPHAQIPDIPPALVSEGNSKMGQVAPAPYVPDKKLKVILRSNTSNTAQLDPEDKKYD